MWQTVGVLAIVVGTEAVLWVLSTLVLVKVCEALHDDH